MVLVVSKMALRIEGGQSGVVKVTHLSQTQVHERNIIDDRPTHANHHEGTSSSHSERSGNNTALHTRTLKYSLWTSILGVSKQLSDSLCVVFGTQVTLYLVSLTLGNKLFGKFEALGLEVGNDKRMCARSTGREEGDQTDGSGTTDYSTAS